MIKTLQIRNGEKLPQLDEKHLQNPTANIILNGLELNAEEQGKGVPCSQHHTVCPSWYKKTSKGHERYMDWEGRNKLVLFTGDMIIYVEIDEISEKMDQ